LSGHHVASLQPSPLPPIYCHYVTWVQSGDSLLPSITCSRCLFSYHIFYLFTFPPRISIMYVFLWHAPVLTLAIFQLAVCHGVAFPLAHHFAYLLNSIVYLTTCCSRATSTSSQACCTSFTIVAHFYLFMPRAAYRLPYVTYIW
jgi:hypothetical protein